MEDPVTAAVTIIEARLPAALEALYPINITAPTGAAADNPEQPRIYHIPNDHSSPDYWSPRCYLSHTTSWAV